MVRLPLWSVALLAFSGPVQASEWVRIGSSKGAAMFMDPTSIKKVNSYLAVKLKKMGARNGGHVINEQMIYFDCHAAKFAVKSSVAVPRTGELLSNTTADKDLKFSPLVPNTALDSVRIAVCR